METRGIVMFDHVARVQRHTTTKTRDTSNSFFKASFLRKLPLTLGQELGFMFKTMFD